MARVAEDDAIVCLDYAALLRGDELSAEIDRAFGASGLGILTVRGIPGLNELRMGTLPLIRRSEANMFRDRVA
jgi:hypothetical protein